ncbi:quaternary ammonium compound-resistance protein SugE [Gracilibacillus orientalis]|uniref:Quaternary ammonium compound-resistance protein SugE n=1 Tax=Gracilibacillus orientalis TaxID=334253 RepID=A0A1I4NFL2_9BACI|nr:multidrug efflux SMR transporter [Gracilibacillus orientalis]SFM14291.1 quaternary ammonium compound-resistance protein SugE [Gracilibacillus orientalis]
MLGWIFLIIAALLEPVWSIALKYSYGFKYIWPSVISIFAAGASFYLLSLALKSLPVGTAYAVWVGIGAIGVIIAGVMLFEENISPTRIVFLILILIGVVGLQIIEG